MLSLLHNQKLINKTNILNVCFILFCLSHLRHFIWYLRHSWDYRAWTITEFLINYQGGFVRRALVGEILFRLYKFGIDPQLMIKIICCLCICFIILFFIKYFRKQGFSLYLLPLCFFLGELFGELFEEQNWMRKDVITISLFIIIIFIARNNKLLFHWKILLINLLSIVAVFIHEAFVFFSLPILFILFYNYLRIGKSSVKSLLFAALSLIPTASAFLLVAFFHGDLDTAKAIWQSYPFLGEFQIKNEVTAIDCIAWSVLRNVKICVKANFLYANEGIISIVGWTIIFPVVYYLITNTLLVFGSKSSFTERHKTVLSALLLFQFVSLLPLWLLLFDDYHRLFFFLTTSTFVVFLIFPIDDLEKLFPKPVLAIVNRFNLLFPKPNKTIIVLLMAVIGIPPRWYLHWLLAFKTSMIYHVMYVVSKPLLALRDPLIEFFNFLFHLIP
jgi:hypothetical protein